MNHKIKYVVSSECGRESDPLDTMEQAEKWVYECLPIGIQKCRTGSYEILEVVEDENGWNEIYKGKIIK